MHVVQYEYSIAAARVDWCWQLRNPYRGRHCRLPFQAFIVVQISPPLSPQAKLGKTAIRANTLTFGLQDVC
jgi:hypothetical protein